MGGARVGFSLCAGLAGVEGRGDTNLCAVMDNVKIVFI